MKKREEKSSPCRYADERSLGPLQGHFPIIIECPFCLLLSGSALLLAPKKRVKLLTRQQMRVGSLEYSLP